MTPERSASPSARKKASPGKRAAANPAAASPMKAHEIAHGPNATGHDDQARAAHVPVSSEGEAGAVQVERPNTPPSSESSAAPTDQGQE